MAEKARFRIYWITIGVLLVIALGGTSFYGLGLYRGHAEEKARLAQQRSSGRQCAVEGCQHRSAVKQRNHILFALRAFVRFEAN